MLKRADLLYGEFCYTEGLISEGSKRLMLCCKIIYENTQALRTNRDRPQEHFGYERLFIRLIQGKDDGLNLNALLFLTFKEGPISKWGVYRWGLHRKASYWELATSKGEVLALANQVSAHDLLRGHVGLLSFHRKRYSHGISGFFHRKCWGFGWPTKVWFKFLTNFLNCSKK